MISSHCLPWFFILYGNFEYRIVAGLRFQFKTNIKTNNQNASSWLYNIRRGLPTPQKDCHAGKMKLTDIAVLTKNLPIQGTLSINLFWTTKYCYRKQSGKKADGERQDKWKCLKKWDDKREGKEPRYLPYTFLPVTLGRIRLMGMIWGKALTTMLAILFFWVV